MRWLPVGIGLGLLLSTAALAGVAPAIVPDSPAAMDYAKLAKPHHVRLSRADMLAAWRRLLAVEIPGLPGDQRFDLRGREFHVGPTGDDAADGTKERPWRTLAHAAGKMGPGTVVYLHAGTYYGPVAIAAPGASADAPAALRAAQGEHVVVTYGEDWVAAERAKLAPPLPATGQAGAAGDVRRRAVDAAGTELHYPPLVAVKGRYVEVSGLHLVGVRNRLPHNLYSESGICFLGGGGEGCRALYNEIENVGHCGVKEMGHGGRGILIEGNYIHDLGQTFHDHGIYCPADDVVVRRNLLINCTGWGLHAYSAPKRIVVSHNIVAGNDCHGLLFAGPDAVVTHNVLYRNGKGGVFLFRSGATGCRLASNLFVESVAMEYDCLGDAKAYPSGNRADYNAFAPPTKVGRPAPADDYGAHNVTADPLVADVARLDFQPRPGSPLIDAGDKSLGAYRGAAPDIGLCETGQGPVEGREKGAGAFSGLPNKLVR